jgi:hypothetical protein
MPKSTASFCQTMSHSCHAQKHRVVLSDDVCKAVDAGQAACAIASANQDDTAAFLHSDAHECADAGQLRAPGGRLLSSASRSWSGFALIRKHVEYDSVSSSKPCAFNLRYVSHSTPLRLSGLVPSCEAGPAHDWSHCVQLQARCMHLSSAWLCSDLQRIGPSHLMV